MKKLFTFLSYLLLLSHAHADDLYVLPKKSGENPKQMMRRYLKRLAMDALQRRSKLVGTLQKKQIQDYQQRLRQFFIKQLGGFPKRTPLHAKVVGKLEVDGCHIEKIIFESRPQHYVTANLYLPKGEGPFPAVLIPCGHTHAGKASNQRLCTFFAHSGLAAFTYDPIGQGERYQLLNKDGKNRYKSTTEHTMVGISSILVGRNTASYRIWDGIRCLDYLQSRRDIDGKKLGCTGVSGGGTLTEYLMALDDRIQCAAPACAPTTFARRLETIGPGDAEQNIFAQIAYGFDHADYSILRATKPTLLLTASRDFVDIQGSWDLFREVKRLYTKLGHPEKIALIEADAKHGFSLRLREGTVRWMRRWLLNKVEPITEPVITTRSQKDLLCTQEGQVQLLPSAKSVLDLNLEVANNYKEHRKKLWQNRAMALKEVRRLTGIRQLSALRQPEIQRKDVIQRKGYHIEKLLFHIEGGLQLPALLFKPAHFKGHRVLYLHGLGKHHDAGSGGPIEKLVQQGQMVLAIDLRGIGETGTSTLNQWGGNFYDIFLAYLLGKSFLGMRTEDTLIAARFLSQMDNDGKPMPVEVIGLNVAGPIALHAATMEPQLFSKVMIKESIKSWMEIINDPSKQGQLIHAVHGALTTYDLVDLIATKK